MCGIVGEIASKGSLRDAIEAHIKSMSAEIVHRGPDEFGCEVWELSLIHI